MTRQDKTFLNTMALLLAGVLLQIVPAQAQPFACLPTCAPDLMWVQQMGGVGSEWADSVATDARGNVYTTGDFRGMVDFDPDNATDGDTLTAAGSSDGFLSKHDSDGNFVWVKQMGGPAGEFGGGVATDARGNVYTTGGFRGMVDFDPDNLAAEDTLTSAGAFDGFLSKHDRDGNFVWVKQMSGTRFGNDLSVATDVWGNVYTAGSFFNMADFDPDNATDGDTLTSAGSSDGFLSKHDSEGNFVWVKQMGGPAGEFGGGVATDARGNVYTTGGFRGMVDFDPDNLAAEDTLTSAGNSDGFLSKHDSDGNFVWVKQMGGTAFDWAAGVATDVWGNVYTAGSFQLEVDFDPDNAAAGDTLTSAGSSDGFLSKHDRDGNFVWVKQMGGAGNDTAFGVATDVRGNVYATGGFFNEVDFDPDNTAAGDTLTSAGFSDGFLAKLR